MEGQSVGGRLYVAVHKSRRKLEVGAEEQHNVSETTQTLFGIYYYIITAQKSR